MEGLQGIRLPATRALFGGLWPFLLIPLIAGAPFLLIPLIAGAPFLLIGLSETHKTVQLERTWVSTGGTVVDNTVVAFATGASYAPVVDFQTWEGKTVRFVDGAGSIPPDYQVGAEVHVFYDPGDVRNARVASWTRLWLGPTLLICSGLLPVLIAAVVLWLVARGVGSSRRPVF
jgi:hypothetical protein